MVELKSGLGNKKVDKIYAVLKKVIKAKMQLQSGIKAFTVRDMQKNTIISASTVGMSVVIAAVIFVAQSPSILQGNLTMSSMSLASIGMMQPPMPVNTMPSMPVDTMQPQDGFDPEEMADMMAAAAFVPGTFDEVVGYEDASSSVGTENTSEPSDGLTGGTTGGSTTGGTPPPAPIACANGQSANLHGNNIGRGTGIDLDQAKAIAAAIAQATKMAEDGCKTNQRNPDQIDPNSCPKDARGNPILTHPNCKTVVPPAPAGCTCSTVTTTYANDRNNPVQVSLSQPYATNRKWRAIYQTSGTCTVQRTGCTRPAAATPATPPTRPTPKR